MISCMVSLVYSFAEFSFFRPVMMRVPSESILRTLLVVLKLFVSKRSLIEAAT